MKRRKRSPAKKQLLQVSPALLRAKRLKGWGDRKAGRQLATRCDLLDAVLVFEGTLFMAIGETPTRLDAKKGTAI